jgi:spore coat protein U-like protein
MTTGRSALIAMVAVVLLIGAPPIAGDEQFPRGLLSAEPRKNFCTIETRPLSFGTYYPLDEASLDGVGQVIYTCGSGNGPDIRSPKNIRIEMERGASNSYSDRRMFGPDPVGLQYNIYLDATHRTIWGDGTNGTEFYFDAKPPNGTPVTVPAYGRIRARQDVNAGQYADQPAIRILW